MATDISEWREACTCRVWRELTAMFQRAADSVVLMAFAIVYSCAVLVLKRRTKALAEQPQAARVQGR